MNNKNLGTLVLDQKLRAIDLASTLKDIEWNRFGEPIFDRAFIDELRKDKATTDLAEIIIDLAEQDKPYYKVGSPSLQMLCAFYVHDTHQGPYLGTVKELSKEVAEHYLRLRGIFREEFDTLAKFGISVNLNTQTEDGFEVVKGVSYHYQKKELSAPDVFIERLKKGDLDFPYCAREMLEQCYSGERVSEWPRHKIPSFKFSPNDGGYAGALELLSGPLLLLTENSQTFAEKKSGIIEVTQSPYDGNMWFPSPEAGGQERREAFIVQLKEIALLYKPVQVSSPKSAQPS